MENSPRPRTRPNAYTAEVTFAYFDHLELQQQILDSVNALHYRATPDQIEARIGGISLRGAMPVTMHNQLGNSFNGLSFEAIKTADDYSDAAIRFWLHSDNPDKQKHLFSADTPVEYAQNKPIYVQPYKASEVVAAINFGDLCNVLDDTIPDCERRFSALSDPRLALSFDAAATGMTDLLGSLTKRKQIVRGYTARDYQVSAVGDSAEGMYDAEVNAQLKIGQVNEGRPMYTLRMGAPMNIWGQLVAKQLEYSFTHPSTRRDKPPRLTLSMLSETVSTADLKQSVHHTKNSVDISQFERALGLLQQKHIPAPL